MDSVVLFFVLLAGSDGRSDDGVLVAAVHGESRRRAGTLAASFSRGLPPAVAGAPSAVDVPWVPAEGVAALARRAPQGTSYTVAVICRQACSAEIARNGGGPIRTVAGPFSESEIGAVAARVVQTMMTEPSPPGRKTVSRVRPQTDAPGAAVTATVADTPPASLWIELGAGGALSGADVGPAFSLGVGWQFNERWAADAVVGAAPGAARAHEGSRIEPFRVTIDGGAAYALVKSESWSLKGTAGPRLLITRLDAAYPGGQDSDTVVDWGMWAGASVQYAVGPRFHFFSAAKAAYLPARREWERKFGHSEAEYKIPQFESSLVAGVGAQIF